MSKIPSLLSLGSRLVFDPSFMEGWMIGILMCILLFTPAKLIGMNRSVQDVCVVPCFGMCRFIPAALVFNSKPRNASVLSDSLRVHFPQSVYSSHILCMLPEPDTFLIPVKTNIRFIYYIALHAEKRTWSVHGGRIRNITTVIETRHTRRECPDTRLSLISPITTWLTWISGNISSRKNSESQFKVICDQFMRFNAFK